MTKSDFRHAGATELADVLDLAIGLSTDDPRDALANAVERTTTAHLEVEC